VVGIEEGGEGAEQLGELTHERVFAAQARHEDDP